MTQTLLQSGIDHKFFADNSVRCSFGLYDSYNVKIPPNFNVDCDGDKDKLQSDHHHDGPRTLIRGRMAPCRLRPAGYLPRSVRKTLLAFYKCFDIVFSAYPPSLCFARLIPAGFFFSGEEVA